MTEMYLVFIIRRPYQGRLDLSESCMQFAESFPTEDAAVKFANELGEGFNSVIIKGTVI